MTPSHVPRFAPHITIRKVDGPTNSADIYNLQAICLPEDAPVSTDGGEWWLAYDDDEPVGFACLTASKSLSNHGYLSRSGVLPRSRGQGIQKRLIRCRLSRAKAHGWAGVVSDTSGNPPSANSLIACGFRCYDPERPWGFPHTIYWRVRFNP